jgi:hypothetical protein
MHHIHMSTGFFFVLTFGFIGLVAIIFAFVRSMKNDRLDAERAIEAMKVEQAYRAANPVRVTAEQIQQVHGERLAVRQSVNGSPFASAPSAHVHTTVFPQQQMVPAVPVYAAHDPMLGLATGMLLGNALSHGHDHTTTIIHDSAPSYVDSGPSYSSSSSSDSGFSYSDSSSSSSSDSSGGFDASW